ncbi:GNAT family N-acetyltransferase [Streptococcus merionis]|uniref:GNAT family N-acetyltransferase n=1 Tax=Streptococcus merionis TaxID=400065 RepID=UPI0035123225
MRRKESWVMTIRPVTEDTVSAWAQLAARVWHSNSETLRQAFLAGQFPYEFLYWQGEDAVGVISLSLRQDYVEGSHNRPTAFLEGIYVLPNYRKQGLASAMVDYAKAWACQQGVQQLASNCELANEVSQAFHQSLGFQEVSRTVHYLMDTAVD